MSTGGDGLWNPSRRVGPKPIARKQRSLHRRRPGRTATLSVPLAPMPVSRFAVNSTRLGSTASPARAFRSRRQPALEEVRDLSAIRARRPSQTGGPREVDQLGSAANALRSSRMMPHT